MTVSYRPRRLTRVCRGVAALVVVVFTVIGVTLRSAAGGDAFGVADQIAMIAFGLLLASAVLSFTRARVTGDATGMRIRNVFGEKFVPWQVVRDVRLDDGQPWAHLELHDDETLALLALQANDGEYAVRGVLGLRELMRTSRRPAPREAGEA
ncbi:MAG: PH domain-containing protein [Actinomycetota bacterium]|nr:PH domain-containing protein [Actinomycetota bacterium]